MSTFFKRLTEFLVYRVGFSVGAVSYVYAFILTLACCVVVFLSLSVLFQWLRSLPAHIVGWTIIGAIVLLIIGLVARFYQSSVEKLITIRKPKDEDD